MAGSLPGEAAASLGGQPLLRFIRRLLGLRKDLVDAMRFHSPEKAKKSNNPNAPLPHHLVDTQSHAEDVLLLTTPQSVHILPLCVDAGPSFHGSESFCRHCTQSQSASGHLRGGSSPSLPPGPKSSSLVPPSYEELQGTFLVLLQAEATRRRPTRIKSRDTFQAEAGNGPSSRSSRLGTHFGKKKKWRKVLTTSRQFTEGTWTATKNKKHALGHSNSGTQTLRHRQCLYPSG